MNIFETEFYKYSSSYFDENSILENEVLNNCYLIKTKELLTQDKKYYGQLVLGFYRNKWYPVILPLNVKDGKKLLEFTEVLNKDYKIKPLIASDLFKALSIEKELERLDEQETKQLELFLDILKTASLS